MVISSWLNLAKLQIGSLEAELLMAHVVSQDRSFLVAHGERKLEREQINLADRMLKLRLMGVPMAYILGHKEFYGRKFKVTPDVLVPRPETEMMIDLTKKLSPKTILDVGTGSGCIAVTLALEMPESRVTAIDISELALDVAMENADELGARVRFVQSDLLENFKEDLPDLVIANLPYVSPEWEWSSRELEFEPSLALYAEDDGLELIKLLLDKISEMCYNEDVLRASKYLLLEADLSQHQKIIDYAKNLNFKHNLTEGLILQFNF